MTLRNQLEASGSWLFRHRSYFPLAMLPVFIICFPASHYLFHRHAINECWQLACMGLSFFGLFLRILVVGHAPYGTSGRNTREQKACSLNTTGLYSLVRHPLYLANYIIVLGFAMVFHIWWLVLLTTAVYALYYERIMLAEEAFLRISFGERFEGWALNTPSFIPRFRGWKSPEMRFCWRTVLQREYNAFFLIITLFFLYDVIGDSVVDRNFHVSLLWLGIFLSGFLVFAILRTLKKRTHLLTVADR